MAIGAAIISHRDRNDSLSQMYWLDINVNFNDILRQQRMISSDRIGRLAPSSSKSSVLTGFGTVANGLSVGDSPATFSRFDVDVAAFVQTDENFEQAEVYRSAKMIWNDVDIQSPRLKIYAQPKIMRQLVELYVTKRIDTIIMSMKIAVTRQSMADTGPGLELLPVLDTDRRLYFRRTQCELLSVHASLVSGKIARQS